MKKLLLVSMFQNVSHLLQRVMPDYKGKSVAYIPTASLAEEPGDWAALEKQNLEQMGLVVDEVEVSTAPYAAIQRALQKNDLIYIAGGKIPFPAASAETERRGPADPRGGPQGKALYRGIGGRHRRGPGHRLFVCDGRPRESAGITGLYGAASDGMVSGAAPGQPGVRGGGRTDCGRVCFHAGPEGHRRPPGAFRGGRPGGGFEVRKPQKETNGPWPLELQEPE